MMGRFSRTRYTKAIHTIVYVWLCHLLIFVDDLIRHKTYRSPVKDIHQFVINEWSEKKILTIFSEPFHKFNSGLCVDAFTIVIYLFIYIGNAPFLRCSRQLFSV